MIFSQCWLNFAWNACTNCYEFLCCLTYFSWIFKRFRWDGCGYNRITEESGIWNGWFRCQMSMWGQWGKTFFLNAWPKKIFFLVLWICTLLKLKVKKNPVQLVQNVSPILTFIYWPKIMVLYKVCAFVLTWKPRMQLLPVTVWKKCVKKPEYGNWNW